MKFSDCKSGAGYQPALFYMRKLKHPVASLTRVRGAFF